ncbi:hypothetical protein ELH13_08165 [Rhizobium ruizarguesonis]|nr:hypothetical protein ELH13_08165 [Rhizobium ruizarguesonis]
MARRKGELTPAAIDRGWPFQVALLAELSKGKLCAEQALYCNRRSRPRWSRPGSAHQPHGPLRPILDGPV